jgi:hypothetical protein
MNKLIQELAEQATTYIEPTSNSGEGWIFDKEKFAELIVRECAEIVKDSPWKLGSSYSASDQANLVKKHFGVEL